MIERIKTDLYYRIHSGVDQSWNWFNTLSQEEWLVVLMVTCACGFLCIRGFGGKRLVVDSGSRGLGHANS